MKSVNKSKEFRLQGKSLFLTYPQCNAELSSVLKQLTVQLGRFNIKEYLLVREDHSDLSVNVGVHVHVYIECIKKFDIKGADRLDIIGSDGQTFHGNYVVPKNRGATINYLLKDAVDLEKIVVSQNLKLQLSKINVLEPLHNSLLRLAKEGRMKEAMELLEREDPKLYVKSHAHYEKSLREIFLRGKGITRKFDFSKFSNVPEHLTREIDGNINSKTVYISGPAGSGKTEFVKTYLTEKLCLVPVVISNLDSLGLFNPNVHNCIVFDDCSFKELEREEFIKLFDVENDVTLKIRYVNIYIPAMTFRVVIHNKELKSVTPFGDDPAILRRIHEIILEGALFKSGVEVSGVPIFVPERVPE